MAILHGYFGLVNVFRGGFPESDIVAYYKTPENQWLTQRFTDQTFVPISVQRALNYTNGVDQIAFYRMQHDEAMPGILPVDEAFLQDVTKGLPLLGGVEHIVYSGVIKIDELRKGEPIFTPMKSLTPL